MPPGHRPAPHFPPKPAHPDRLRRGAPRAERTGKASISGCCRARGGEGWGTGRAAHGSLGPAPWSGPGRGPWRAAEADWLVSPGSTPQSGFPRVPSSPSRPPGGHGSPQRWALHTMACTQRAEAEGGRGAEPHQPRPSASPHGPGWAPANPTSRLPRWAPTGSQASSRPSGAVRSTESCTHVPNSTSTRWVSAGQARPQGQGASLAGGPSTQGRSWGQA